MKIVTRAEWGAQRATSRTVIDTPTRRLWLHHSAGALDANGNGVWWDDVRGIQNFHMRPVSDGGKGWSDIAYSFLVGGGQIFEGRGVGIAGGHTKGDNTGSHAICLIGDYSWMTPKQEDLQAIAWLMGHGKAQGWWGDLTGPHRDAPGASTACCGVNLIACIPDLHHIASAPTPDPIQEDDEDMAKQIVWYEPGHAYVVRDGFDAKHLPSYPAVEFLRSLIKAGGGKGWVAEAAADQYGGQSNPLKKSQGWHAIMAFLDGPLKNV